MYFLFGGCGPPEVRNSFRRGPAILQAICVSELRQSVLFCGTRGGLLCPEFRFYTRDDFQGSFVKGRLIVILSRSRS